MLNVYLCAKTLQNNILYSGLFLLYHKSFPFSRAIIHVVLYCQKQERNNINYSVLLDSLLVMCCRLEYQPCINQNHTSIAKYVSIHICTLETTNNLQKQSEWGRARLSYSRHKYFANWNRTKTNLVKCEMIGDPRYRFLSAFRPPPLWYLRIVEHFDTNLHYLPIRRDLCPSLGL